MEEVIMHTNDAMFAISDKIEGHCKLVKFKGEITFTVYEDSNFQLFYTESHHCVYKKAEEKVYTMKMWAWIAMTSNIHAVLEDSVIRYDWLKRLDNQENTKL